MRVVFAGLLACCFLAACTQRGPTPYQPSGESAYGYQEQKLDSGSYRLAVAGNELTPRSLVENQLFYRAAELARAEGAERFLLTGFEVSAIDDREPQQTVVVVNGLPGWSGPDWSLAPSSTTTVGSGIVHRRYVATAFVRFVATDAPLPEDAAVFDATEVEDNLSDRINRTPVTP